MSSNITGDTRQIVRGIVEHYNWFSLSGEWERTTIHSKRRNLLPVGTEKSPLGAKASTLVFSFTFSMQQKVLGDCEMFRIDWRA